MLRAAGVHMHKRRLPPVSSGYFTAQSVFAALGEMVRDQGRELSGLKVAVEGFGKVGGALAGLLAEAGALVVAISTSDGGVYDPDGLDIPALQHMLGQAGSHLVKLVPSAIQIDAHELPGLPVDALCPCANIHSIHEGNAHNVQAGLLCPGANNPWTDSAAAILEAKGALLLPDYAANAGGILGTVLAYACFPQEETQQFVRDQFVRSTSWILQRSRTGGIPLRETGEELMALRGARLGQGGGQGSPGWALRLGLAMHRRGLIPGSLVRRSARVYLQHRLRLPSAR
jgi:glutamate dehydrogenase/leucine dehydrogenase